MGIEGRMRGTGSFDDFLQSFGVRYKSLDLDSSILACYSVSWSRYGTRSAVV